MLKAYQADADWAEYSAIVFAETRGKARYAAKCTHELCDFEFTDIRVKRVPEFDQYKNEHSIPVSAFFEHGWWYSCSNCHGRAYPDESVILNDLKREVLCENCARGQGHFDDEEE